MKVKIKKLIEKAVIPIYAKLGDAGMDLTAITKDDFSNYSYIEYGTGLSIEIPEGYVGLLFPRSSNSKTSLILSNSVGVIDSGYRGEIKLRFKEIDTNDIEYSVGDRIGQIIILPYPKIEFEEVSELSNTDRGIGGFGSTDFK